MSELNSSKCNDAVYSKGKIIEVLSHLDIAEEKATNDEFISSINSAKNLLTDTNPSAVAIDEDIVEGIAELLEFVYTNSEEYYETEREMKVYIRILESRL